MVGTSPLRPASTSNLHQQRLGEGGRSPHHQNQVKSQNFFSSKTRHHPQQARMSPKTSYPCSTTSKPQQDSRYTPTKFSPSSPASRSSATSSAPLRISPSHQEQRRDRHRSYNGSVSSMSTSPSSPRTSPAFSSPSNSPSPKLGSIFAASTCYQAPTPASLPLPPTQWISMSSPPPAPARQVVYRQSMMTCASSVLSAADQSQHLKTLLKVLA
jgi:hypothetical protein